MSQQGKLYNFMPLHSQSVCVCMYVCVTISLCSFVSNRFMLDLKKEQKETYKEKVAGMVRKIGFQVRLHITEVC